MSLQVDVGTDGLSDLSRALTKKRLDYVKLSNALNEPPRGLSDLMAQSRAFTERLTHFLEDGSELSDAIKNELVDDNGFPGHVRRLPLEEVYSDLDRVKEELRVADGYQPYIVAPEAGLRDLFKRSIGSLVNPVRDLVDSVHGIVTMAADKALNESCQVPALDRGPPVVRFPNFIESISPVAMLGLEDLKEEAMNVAVRIVEMEQSFVTCSFFRYLTFKRIHEQEEAQRQRDLGRRPRRGDDDEADDEDEDADSVAETEVSTPPVIPGDAVPNVYTSPDAVFGMSGYLEKSSTHSRNKFTQFESSLWQRRFFGVRDNAKTLEYYYSEDAFLKGAQPSVVIQLADCVVSDTDGQGVLPQSSLSKSKDQLDEETQISLLVSIRNKDPDKPVYKSSKDLILRAEDAADKYRWLNYLRNTISDSRAGARVATWSTRAIRKPPTPSDTGSVQERRSSLQVREDYMDILDVGHGLGSAIFWDPICRDQNNGLMPSPGIFIDGDTDLSVEKALIQHAADMKAYTRLACDTLVMTVPKVIVHCLVDKATEKLGPKIEEYVLGLTQDARDMLLEEDVGIAGHRRKVQESINDIAKAQDQLKDAERGMGAATSVKVEVSIIELAGLTARLKRREDGSVVFITKPKPPTVKRNVTPERRRDPPPAAPQPAAPQPPQRPQRPAPVSAQRQAPMRGQNGGGGTRKVSPKRDVPPVAVNAASVRPVSPSPIQTGSSNGSTNQQNKPQAPKQQQGWYGFKPFGR